MPYEEYLKWITFFRRRPVGWREDHRTALLMNAAGVKAKGHELFASLRLMKNVEDDTKMDDRAVPKGVMLNMMMSAKGGDKGVNLIGGKKNGKKSS